MISDLIGLSSNGKIQFLGNTGSLGIDSWGKIGLKVERLIADGFEFEKNVYFYRDRNLGEMKINNDWDSNLNIIKTDYSKNYIIVKDSLIIIQNQYFETLMEWS